MVSLVNERLFDSEYTDIEILDIINLLTTCLEQNFFNFNNETYIQKTGLAMGSPLSPILADIFMHSLESYHILHNNPFTSHIQYYYRYVDDILILWSGPVNLLPEFLGYVNSIHTTIKFTLETQDENRSLNFLDLNIKLSDNKHSFDIFRKPTHTGVVIDNTSLHPISHKLAAFNCYINRVLNIPLSQENYNKEILIIKQIASNHNYNSTLIDTLLTKRLNKNIQNAVYINQPTTTPTNLPYRSLTYIGPVTHRISNCFNHFYHISLKSSNSVEKLLVNNKDKINPLDRCGVYKLSCNTCNATYIGCTYRNFKTRLKEHVRCLSSTSGFSHFAKHLTENNHSFDNSLKILHLMGKGKLLNNLESLEILKDAKNPNTLSLNAQLQFESTLTFSVII